MAKKGFTHLHLHSQYSLLDGAISFERLFKRCRQMNMDAVALTDHGNLFGTVEFYTKAMAAHVKPIIGMEAYTSPGSRFDRTKCSISDASYHLILLAENNTGYKNLLKLATAGYTEGFYYRPRIDKQILAELSEGLIATSACTKGQLASLISQGRHDSAAEALDDFLKIFGCDRFFVEIQIHQADDPEVRRGLIDLAAKKGVGIVATNDVHFLDAEDHEAHNCLCCISTGKQYTDPDRLIYPADIFLKSPAQMRRDFTELPEACDNTILIAERANVELDLKNRHAPRYRPADDSRPEDFLRKLVFEGAAKRYGRITEQLEQRLGRELEVIESKGFASYFLIVWDLCKHAHEHNIPAGARGSAVGTLVGYCLGLCNVDPIKYDLLFERFMDPQRNEMPDVDIDICQSGRAGIIEYVRRRYGHVAQIITFGTMKARAVIRDVCRVLGVPLAEADRLAKLVPESLGITLDQALKSEPRLKQEYAESPQTKKVIDICKKLEGLARHASVHAAGVVIADKPLTDFLPLYKPPGSEEIITQFEGTTVEKVGLLKMDFLGLKTLSVLERARQLVEQIHDVKIDLENLDLGDAKVLQVFASGRTKGIFQFESGGMQDLLMRMKPDRFEDLIAANALYRPGPMILIPDYIDRKHGARWELPHPLMRDILEETYGIMVYQEQVMRICSSLGDIGLREAYTLIKAISKKKAKTIAKERERFIQGCKSKGLRRNQAEKIFELIERFAGYGFNKSHSTRYAVIAYQTAYMKAYWPLEYMAAVLTFEMDNLDKLADYIRECRRMKIEVSAPDVNQSGVDFTPMYKNAEARKRKEGIIRFGLAAVRGVGEKAVEQIIAARRQGPFQSLFHFCESVDLRTVNKQVIEALIKAGAFDRLGANRAQMAAGLEKAIQIGSDSQADRLGGQMTLFGGRAQSDYSEDHKILPAAAPWPETQMLAYEKQVLGFYVTSNPLSHYAETIDTYSTLNTAQLAESSQGRPVIIGGMIEKVRHNIIKSGRNAGSRMAVAILEDLQGRVDVVLFPDTFKKFGGLLEEGMVIFVKGRLDHKRERPNVIADELIELDQIKRAAGRVRIKLDAACTTKEKVAMIRSVCEHHKGKLPVYVAIKASGGNVYARLDSALSVQADMDFCRKMRQIVGTENFQLTSQR